MTEMINRNEITEFVLEEIKDISSSGVEVSLESHIYRDLEFDSFDIMLLAMFIEEQYNLLILGSFFHDSGEEPPTLLGFSKYAVIRKKEIEKFSELNNVVPFSVGFICVCLEQILAKRKLVSSQDVFRVVVSKISEIKDIKLEHIKDKSEIYKDLHIDAEEFIKLIEELQIYFFTYFPEKILGMLIDSQVKNKLEEVNQPDFLRKLQSRIKSEDELQKYKVELEEELNTRQFVELSKGRKKIIEEFASKYNVIPFSVAFICSCIEHALQEVN